MKRRTPPLAALLLLLLAPCAAVHARQSADARTAQKGDEAKQEPATGPAEERYAALLAKAKAGDRSVDFTELRMAYAETKDYDPYSGHGEARKAMFAAINAGDWDEALKQSAKILEKNYVDINGQFGAYVASARKGDRERALLHKFVFEGLIKSVRGGGDGRSPEKAFVVISTDEEYALLNYLGLRPSGQSLLNAGGHNYDKLRAVEPETNKTYEFYFQIDKPFGWLARGMK